MDKKQRLTNSGQGLVLGTILLLISNIFVKGLGFFYRVMLVRRLGAEGMGLVEMVSPLYSFLLVIAGCGLQPALSQIIAGRGRERQQLYFRTARRLLLFSGCIVTTIAYLTAPWLVSLFIADQRVRLCFQTLLPAVLIISWAAAWRGCFQGQRQMSVIGMSQNTEQLVRVALGLWLVGRLSQWGIECAISATALASVGGELAGFLYLVWRMASQRRRQQPQSRQTYYTLAESTAAAREMLSFGLPTTAGRTVSTLIMIAQAFLIPSCLQAAGWDARAATEMYGRFSGVALTLVHLPGVFTSALTVSVLPAVAESMTIESSGRQLLQKRITGSLQAVAICTAPCMVLLFLLSDVLCVRLFSNPPAAELVRWLSCGGVFFYFQVTLASVLQGLGEVKRLLLNNTAAGVLMLTGIWALTRRPELGILGAALAVDLSWLAGFIFNALSVQQICRLHLSWKRIVLPTVSALLPALGVCLWYISRRQQPVGSWSEALCVAALLAGVYLLGLLLNRRLIITPQRNRKRIVSLHKRN